MSYYAWSTYSFAVGLTLGGGVVGILFLVHWMSTRDRVRWLEHKIFLSEYEKLPWEIREPGASDIGARLPLPSSSGEGAPRLALDQRSKGSDTLG